MHNETDEIAELIKKRLLAANRNASDAISRRSLDRASYWTGYCDALKFALQHVNSKTSQAQLPLAAPQTEPSTEMDDAARLPTPPVMRTIEPHDVTVRTEELIGALRQIVRFRKRTGRHEMMAISYGDGRLKFSMLKVSVSVPAVGTWSGDVFTSAASIYGIVSVPLTGTTTRISVDGEWLRIGPSEMKAEWGTG